MTACAHGVTAHEVYVGLIVGVTAAVVVSAFAWLMVRGR